MSLRADRPRISPAGDCRAGYHLPLDPGREAQTAVYRPPGRCPGNEGAVPAFRGRHPVCDEVHDRLRADRGGLMHPQQRWSTTQLVPAESDAPARVCMIDIECEDERGFPDTQRDAIICITCHDSFDNDYTTFLFGGVPIPAEITAKEEEGGLKNGCFRKGTHTICTYADEVSMLRAFGAYIADRDPDILSGWNFVEFDMPYITGRMEKLGLSPVMLARLPGMTERNALRGRALFDLLPGTRRCIRPRRSPTVSMQSPERRSGRARSGIPGRSPISGRNNRRSSSNIITRMSSSVLRSTGRTISSVLPGDRPLRRLPLGQDAEFFERNRCLHPRKAHGKYILPSKGFANAEEFEGATVFEPSKGVRENVVVLDLKSLYPMAMMTINASPETKDP